MDWLRLQAWMSAHNSPTKLSDHVDLAKCMNLVDFHTRLVDDLDSTLRNAINLSDFWSVPPTLLCTCAFLTPHVPFRRHHTWTGS